MYDCLSELALELFAPLLSFTTALVVPYLGQRGAPGAAIRPWSSCDSGVAFVRGKVSTMPPSLSCRSAVVVGGTTARPVVFRRGVTVQKSSDPPSISKPPLSNSGVDHCDS